MKNTTALLCLSLVLCGFVTECFGFTLMPKDKRGWTLNSAGYLLGPHAHRTLTDKGGPSGKREVLGDLHKPGFDIYSVLVYLVQWKQNKTTTPGMHYGITQESRTGNSVPNHLGARGSQLHSMDEETLQMVLEFLSFLRLKELGALDHLSFPVSSEESSQT